LTSKIKKYLDFLFSLQRYGIKLGLEHTYSLLKYLEDPHKKIKTIHVAGTNGKGSTCAHIEAVLRHNGFKVGIYTSPHLIHFNERIKVSGHAIKDDEIVYFLDNALDKIKETESTFFETTTAMAFDYFKKKNVDIAVIETGLGGRLDATNVIRPSISVITSISKDHTEILGNSIEEIALEKSGIIKENIPLVIAQQDDKVMEIFKNKTSTYNTSMKISKTPENINFTADGTHFTFENQDYITPLLGSHQACNAALAIDVIREFDPNMGYDAIYNGIKKVFWPGRLQKIKQNIFYDVSHNEDGLKKTLETINKLYPNLDIYGLFCIKKGKDLSSLKDLLLKNFANLFVSEDQNGLLVKSKTVSEELTKFNIRNKQVNSIKQGILILKKLIDDNSIGLIFGSHYIAEEVFNEFEISFDNYDI
jgi:dihydrofolate synthase/folylpolyglutamate synthase